MSRARPDDPNCDQIVELVTDYLEDALPAKERTLFELHLAYCAGCVTFLRQVRSQIEGARGLASPIPIPGELRGPLLRLFHAVRR
jgi:anti-sigma factor RsiW